MLRKDSNEAFLAGAVMTAVLIGGVVLLAMICVSWYGAVTLPSNARVPIHFGVSYNNFVSKRLGLIVHPAVGALLFLISAFVGHGHAAHGASAKAPPLIFLPIIMCVLLVVQVGAITVARRRSGI
jgi:4-amino-4-deoxy-L-arabinose transferase-like glycosyltransferase